MAIQYFQIELPLYDSPSYFYTIPILDTTYKFKYQWNERAKQWTYSIYYADGTPIILGEGLVAEYPILADYVTEPNGVLYLEPIGFSRNQTINNPYEIWKYYKLYFLYAQDDGEEE